MGCKFSKRNTNPNIKVKIEEYTIPQASHSKYLGPIIRSDGEIEIC